jgi:hypothetical protein
MQPALKTLARDARSDYDTLVSAGNQPPTVGVSHFVANRAYSSPSIGCPLFCHAWGNTIEAVVVIV